MGLFNFFKKKKKEAPAREEKKEKSKKPIERKPSRAQKAEKKPAEKKKTSLKPKKTSEVAWRALKEPRVTEKATDLAQQNQYLFEVYPRANKKEIKKAVEDTFGVDVLSVRIINIPAKKRRLGRTEGWQKAYKKAMVRIKEGQKIEVLPR